MIYLAVYLLVGFLFSTFLMSSTIITAVDGKYREEFGELPTKSGKWFAITIISLGWLPFLFMLAFKGFRKGAAKTPRKVILGLTGLAGCGKSTFAKELVTEHGFTEVAFGDHLKKLLAHIFQDDINKYYTSEGKREELTLSLNELNDVSERFTCYLRDALGVQDYLTFRDKFIRFFNEPQTLEITYTRRELMQLIGTDVIKHTDKAFWINLVLNDVALIEGDVVISDVRFNDEADTVHSLGGFNVFIERSSVEALNHSSERGVSVGKIDSIIHNNEDDLKSVGVLTKVLVEGLRYE